ncbi:MAG TPA: chromosomal replication initiator DnaA [Candidatus Sulfotelmatobacter sp.]|nr:chromosomal replication initiator DnaA [Candidatus Sulfotelmatobacter sp.]
MSARQLALDLGHRPALGREDFLLAPGNADAVAWLDRWPDWPAPALSIYGPEGSGKTHLAQVWRARSGASLLAAAALSEAALPALAAQPVVIEDADRGVDERALLHLYNLLAERRLHLLLTGRSAPARWPLALADLRSRLNAAPAAALAPPDESLVGAVLVKLLADRQLRVGDEVVAFLLARLERSFAAAQRIVEALDRAALAQRSNITVPLARQVLQDQAADSAAVHREEN